MKKARRIVTITFVIMGLIFLAAGLAFGVYYDQRTENMIPVRGEVVGRFGDQLVVAYTYGVQTYQVPVDADFDQSYGDPYELMVDPDNPADYMDLTFRIMMWVFSGLGLVLLLTGVIVSVCMSHGERRREALLSYGRREIGAIQEVRMVRSVTVCNRHPWVVIATCVHPLTGQTVTLRSHYLWDCKAVPGQHVEIAFDPINEKKYAMDLHDAEEQPWA